MMELNKEIVKSIRHLDCDNNMKLFLEDILKYELDLLEEGETENTKSKKYMDKISEYSKSWDDE